MPESKLEQRVRHHYVNNDHSCSETLLNACNETFHLGLPDDAYRLLSGFSAGMYTGNVCGALVGCTAALSMMLVTTRAHDTPELANAQRLLVRNFRQELSDTQCIKVKAVHHTKEQGCLATCLLAAKAMNKTVAQLTDQGLIAPGTTVLD